MTVKKNISKKSKNNNDFKKFGVLYKNNRGEFYLFNGKLFNEDGTKTSAAEQKINGPLKKANKDK